MNIGVLACSLCGISQKQSTILCLSGFNIYKLPLYQFTDESICNKMETWVCSDTNYKQNLELVVKIFENKQLNGKIMVNLKANNPRKLIKQQLKQHIADKTLDIALDYFDEYNNEYTKEFIKTKSARDIAEIIYGFPLNRLKKKINEEYQTYSKFINFYSNKHNFITQQTGWESKFVRNIDIILFTYCRFVKKHFETDINLVLQESKLPNNVKQKIESLLLSYDAMFYTKLMSKDKLNVEQLRGQVKNIMHEFTKTEHKTSIEMDVSAQIYETIAKCLSVNQNKCNPWVCPNCFNYNFCNDIDPERNVYVSICSLCSLLQYEAIVVALNGNVSFKSKHTILPLHHLTIQDICYKIKEWRCSDPNYKEGLEQVRNIFVKHRINGNELLNIGVNSVRLMIEQELTQFISPKK
eukprot:259979_1